MSNRFVSLENNDCQEKTANSVEKPIKSPPIFIDNVINIQPLTELLTEKAKGDYEIKILRDHQVKIQSKFTQTYEIIVKELQEKNTEFHTYKLKQDRSFRVVLKNMHPLTDVEEIKTAIEDEGHKVVINIWSIKNRATKQPLPMFFVDLKPSPDNKTIYAIKHLLHCRIVFEAPRPKREIPQCANCQRYGHTKRYCHRKPRCVKCAEEYLTANCPRKERFDQVKCVLCNGNHPANYKGCVVFKELQKSKFPPLRPKKVINAGEDKAHQDKDIKKKVKHRSPSYAGVARQMQNKPTNENPQSQTKALHQSNYLQDIKHILQTVTNQMIAITNSMADLMTKLEQHSIH